MLIGSKFIFLKILPRPKRFSTNTCRIETDLNPNAVKSTMEDRPTEYHTNQKRLLESWEEEEKRGCLYFVSNLSRGKQCALEILNGLIQALAESTVSLGILTWPEEFDAHPDEAAHGCKLLHSMSQALVASGLVPNIVEANAIIIPPFARRRLLDRGPDRQASTADAPEITPTPQESGAHDTEEAGQSKPEDGTTVDDAQVPQVEAELDQSSSHSARWSIFANISEADGMEEVKEPAQRMGRWPWSALKRSRSS
jgi:hypothetical protein